MKEKTLQVADEPWCIQQSTLQVMKRFYKRFYPAFDDGVYAELAEARQVDIISGCLSGERYQHTTAQPLVLLTAEEGGTEPVMQ